MLKRLVLSGVTHVHCVHSWVEILFNVFCDSLKPGIQAGRSLENELMILVVTTPCKEAKFFIERP